MPRNARVAALLVLAALLAPAAPAHAAPANDDFSGAVPVPLGGSATTDITTATFGPGEPVPSCWEFPAESHAVWFRFDAAAGGGVVADTAGSAFASADDDTVLAVYAGADLASLVEVACNDDFGPDYQAQVGWVAATGQTYHLLAGGWDATEVGTLALALEAAPAVSGVTLVAAGGSPAAGVAVDLFDSAGYLLRRVRTDAAGAYGLAARPGDYRVRFGGDGGYVAVWYDGAARFAGATPLALGPGGLTGVGASLVASSIRGTVRDGLTGAPLAGITVSVVDGAGVVVAAATTDAAGGYTAGHLPPGAYRVGFADPAGAYLPRWHPDAPSLAGAVPVDVGSGAVPVVDGLLLLGSGFSGAVSSEAGGPLEGVEVTAVDAFGVEYPAVTTDAGGAYAAEGLPPGAYRVRFADPTRAHVTEWYDDRPAAASADVVTVAPGAVTAGVDAVLAVDPAGPRGDVSGTVTDAVTGAPLAGIEVRIGALVAVTDAAGGYLLADVPAGSHVVEFTDPSGGYQPASVAATVAGGQAATVDAALSRAVPGAITGKVTDAVTGAPLAGIEVRVAALVATTAADGTYLLAGVPPGGQVVEFADPSGGHAPASVTATVTSGGTAVADAALQPVNRAPVAVDDAAQVEQGRKLDGPSVLANDHDPDGDPLTAALLVGPENGTLTFRPDGTYEYKHRGGPEPQDSFTYRATDGALLSAPATVTITVLPRGGSGSGSGGDGSGGDGSGGDGSGGDGSGSGGDGSGGDGSGTGGDPAADPNVLGAVLGRGGDLGLVDPAQGLWHLRSKEGAERAFYYGNPGDYPMMGDWDCDGVDTPGLYRRADGYVYLRNSNTVGIADIRFFFGDPGDLPLSGDFDGDGCDTVSIYRPAEARTYVINELGANEGGLGAAAYSYLFGNPGDKPFVGDFDGDGVETVGLHRESTGLVYFRNSTTTGIADSEFIYGDPGDRLVASDWNADGADSPGVYRPATTTFYLRYENTQGIADESLVMGEPPWLPVAGWFDL